MKCPGIDDVLFWSSEECQDDDKAGHSKSVMLGLGITAAFNAKHHNIAVPNIQH